MDDEVKPRWSLANIFAVPGTGRRPNGHYYRRPRNIGVKRALLSCIDSLRGVSTPPDSYDDIPISTHSHRSWKRHRTTQWKEDL